MLSYVKRFDWSVTASNQQLSKEFELDKYVTKIFEVQLTSDKDDQLYNRGSQSISVNGVEYLPDNFESKLLMTGINTDPNQRSFCLGEIAIQNGKIKVVYKDTDNTAAPFSAYRVSLYVYGEKQEQ
jgi:hypothetical protein